MTSPDPPNCLPDVPFEDFRSLDLRVGQVLDAVPFPEARDPAMKLVVDFGPTIGQLQTSAQVMDYSTEELLGRPVVGAINLGTKRIAGFQSEFLLLGAVSASGSVSLLHPGESATPGERIA